MKKATDPSRLLANRHPHLVEEWHPTKNGELTPFDVTHGERRKVWWLCSECGHEWDAEIRSRSKGSCCPACAGKIVTKKNNLGANYPYLAKEWNPTKNGELTPYDVTCKSNQIVWWLCPTCSCEWKTPIYKRSGGSNCPQCSRFDSSSFEEKTIAYYFSKFIEVITQHKLPESRMLLDVYIPSLKIGIEYDGAWCHQDIEKDKKKDELCKKLGITLYRIREIGCPELNSSSIVHSITPNDKYTMLRKIIMFLMNDLIGEVADVNIERDRPEIEDLYRKKFRESSLGVINPELAKEWHPTKNGMMTPYSYLCFSSKKVWWKCPKCSHEWKANINNRSNGNGCPACSNQVATFNNNLAVTHPELCKEWHPTKNKLTPKKVTYGKKAKVWWLCSKCNYEWEATISNRSKGRGCPQCKRKVATALTNVFNTHPHLKNEWHYALNGKLKPESLTSGSKQKVWWLCSKCTHEWQAVVHSRSKGHGCPECAKKKMIKTRRKNKLLKEQAS